MTVYYKMQHILLQNATPILLQIVTEVYYKIRQVLLQVAIALLKYASEYCMDVFL